MLGKLVLRYWFIATDADLALASGAFDRLIFSIVGLFTLQRSHVVFQ